MNILKTVGEAMARGLFGDTPIAHRVGKPTIREQIRRENLERLAENPNYIRACGELSAHEIERKRASFKLPALEEIEVTAETLEAIRGTRALALPTT